MAAKLPFYSRLRRKPAPKFSLDLVDLPPADPVADSADALQTCPAPGFYMTFDAQFPAFSLAIRRYDNFYAPGEVNIKISELPRSLTVLDEDEEYNKIIADFPWFIPSLVARKWVTLEALLYALEKFLVRPECEEVLRTTCAFVVSSDYVRLITAFMNTEKLDSYGALVRDLAHHGEHKRLAAQHLLHEADREWDWSVGAKRGASANESCPPLVENGDALIRIFDMAVDGGLALGYDLTEIRDMFDGSLAAATPPS